ncbi:hypothetical protein [Deinococcus radiotolerans]|uniref:Transmembrane protein n=1 Tax=Deinococcus radiotolerans TaxID=1309407 RepID=A0ABQ2FQC2_9DEIO|nr:hypothetical protein [Deinococcus radiotolerans]GGL16056.1 hypothetical protein GCM10010844_38670 [Deinococcus radiotolerans]
MRNANRLTRSAPRVLWEALHRLPQVLLILLLCGLLIGAYTTDAWLADLGDTVLGPPVVQEGLRGLIIMAVARAFQLRWAVVTGWSRVGWLLLACGVALNLARGHFSGTPLTLAFALGHLGLLILTTRLMVATLREQRLADECATVRRQLAAAHARIAELEAQHDPDHP